MPKTDVTEDMMAQACALITTPPSAEGGSREDGSGWAEIQSSRSNTTELHYCCYTDDSPEVYITREDGLCVVFIFDGQGRYWAPVKGVGPTVNAAWLDLYERASWPGPMADFCQEVREAIMRYWPASLA